VILSAAYRILVIGIYFGLGACATIPANRFYTLHAPLPAQTAKPIDTALAIGPIDLPQYLDRPQIVSRPNPIRLSVDEFNRWGGSLEEEFSRVLSEHLGNLLGVQRIYNYPARVVADAHYRVTINIRTFEGRLGDVVRLKLSWSIIDERTAKIVHTDQTAYEAPVVGDDYTAYVVALSDTVQQYSWDLARRLASLNP